jgi:hypothetical protein
MRRKIAVLMIPVLIGLSFFYAPRIIDYVAPLKQTTLAAIFGDVRPQIAKLCREKKAFDGSLGTDSKDGWGEEINFTWKSNDRILLRSSGGDKIKGSSDDVIAVASCSDPDLKADK